MISRYTRPEMAKVWTEENKLQKWLEVELAALEGLARYGYIPKDVPAKVRARAKDAFGPGEWSAFTGSLTLVGLPAPLNIRVV